jgi:hypothetical protein
MHRQSMPGQLSCDVANGAVYALNPTNGVTKWQFQTFAPFDSADFRGEDFRDLPNRRLRWLEASGLGCPYCRDRWMTKRAMAGPAE